MDDANLSPIFFHVFKEGDNLQNALRLGSVDKHLVVTGLAIFMRKFLVKVNLVSIYLFILTSNEAEGKNAKFVVQVVQFEVPGLKGLALPALGPGYHLSLGKVACNHKFVFDSHEGSVIRMAFIFNVDCLFILKLEGVPVVLGKQDGHSFVIVVQDSFHLTLFLVLLKLLLQCEWLCEIKFLHLFVVGHSL